MNERIHENPLIGDKVTFLKTSKETNGEYTLVDVELSPKGGNPIHFHKSFSEKFIAAEGVLGLVVDGKKLFLKSGETATAEVGVLHKFYNPSNERIRFTVELRPGSPGFEKSLIIGYALARDGKTNSKGIPKSFSHLALLFSISDTNLPGFLKWIEPILHWQAKRARKRGVEEELMKKYYVE